MADVVALGELLVDFTLVDTDGAGYPTLAAHPGGAPANFLATLSKLGAKTALLSKVGQDAFGKLLLDTLCREGVDVSSVLADEMVFTTLAFVTLDARGERKFSFARKPGADTCYRQEELNLDKIRKAKVFHFGSLSLTHEPACSATKRAVACARESGCLVTYDPNFRPPLWRDLCHAKEQMLWGLKQADVVKLSREELDFLFGMDVQEGAEYLQEEFGLQLVFVTLGAEGCYFANRKTGGYVSALQGVEVRDTTGAGDIFFGSALWKLLSHGKAPRLLEEKELREAVRFACTAAGLSTTRAGGISSIPSLEEVLQKLEG